MGKSGKLGKDFAQQIGSWDACYVVLKKMVGKRRQVTLVDPKAVHLRKRLFLLKEKQCRIGYL